MDPGAFDLQMDHFLQHELSPEQYLVSQDDHRELDDSPPLYPQNLDYGSGSDSATEEIRRKAVSLFECSNRILVVEDLALLHRLALYLEKRTRLDREDLRLATGLFMGIPLSVCFLESGFELSEFETELSAIIEGPIAIISFGECKTLNTQKVARGDLVIEYELVSSLNEGKPDMSSVI